MLHDFLCDSKSFYETVRTYCQKQSQMDGYEKYKDIKNFRELPELPFTPLLIAVSEYGAKYREILNAVCNDFPKLLE